jgi:hypothetical protein
MAPGGAGEGQEKTFGIPLLRVPKVAEEDSTSVFSGTFTAPPGGYGIRRRGQVPAKHIKKRPLRTRGSAPALPLRHIGNIVIWEGNYKSDILNIGTG